MQDNLISFNFTNWVTVVTMVLVGFAILALATQGVRHFRNNSGDA